MRIGIIIGRIGGVDGVALETEKWIDVLKSLGHKIFIVSGQFQERQMDPETETLVPEMSFFSPESYWSQKKAFFHPETDPDELIEHLNLYSKVIYKKLLDWARNNKLDLLISENASACPLTLKWVWLLTKRCISSNCQPSLMIMILPGNGEIGTYPRMKRSISLLKRFFRFRRPIQFMQ